MNKGSTNVSWSPAVIPYRDLDTVRLVIKNNSSTPRQSAISCFLVDAATAVVSIEHVPIRITDKDGPGPSDSRTVGSG